MREYQQHRTSRRNNIIELLIWGILVALLFIPTMLSFLKYPDTRLYIFVYEFYYQFLTAALVFSLLIFFKLIYGNLPAEHLRLKKTKNKRLSLEKKQVAITLGKTEGINVQYIDEIQLIHNRFFLRLVTFLFVGYLIAFVGLAAYYAPCKTFTPLQLCATNRAFDNTPPESVVENLTMLIEKVLQPARDRWNRPIIINSGYRSPQVNKAVRGVKSSQHSSRYYRRRS